MPKITLGDGTVVEVATAAEAAEVLRALRAEPPPTPPKVKKRAINESRREVRVPDQTELEIDASTREQFHEFMQRLHPTTRSLLGFLAEAGPDGASSAEITQATSIQVKGLGMLIAKANGLAAQMGLSEPIQRRGRREGGSRLMQAWLSPDFLTTYLKFKGV